MKLSSRLKETAAALKRRLGLYRMVLAHPATPIAAKLLLGLAVGYALLPFDLIPDFLPIVGQLDDLVIVPLLVMAAMRLIPADIVKECERKMDGA